MNAENPLMMLVYAIVVAIVVYIVLRLLANFVDATSQAWAALAGGIAFVYMIVYGFQLPGKVNPNLQVQQATFSPY